jgi:RAP1 GTPase activating protein 1
MLHVSTMLPFQERDVQQLERKRHIGNDIVVIVFNESGGPFNPATFVSEFNHVFLVVEPIAAHKEPSDAQAHERRSGVFLGRERQISKTQYRISVVAKSTVDIRGAPPAMHYPCILPHDDDTRKWILAKAINLERVALRAKVFSSRSQRTRKALLQDLIQASQ